MVLMLATLAALGVAFRPSRRAAARGRTRRRYDAAAVADLPQNQDAPTTAELIEREAAGRNRVGLVALASAICVTFGFFAGQMITGDAPSITLTDAFLDAAGERAGGSPSLLVPYLEYMDGKLGMVVGQMLLEVLGWTGFGVVLLYLYHAARGRRPEVKSWLRQLIVVSISVVIVGLLLRYIGRIVAFQDFAGSSDQSDQAARDALASGPAAVGDLLYGFGRYAVLAAWALVSLHAMRAGLLTKFLGTLGVLGAVLTALLIQLPVIQIFWLIIVGMTILGRFVAVPPAWASGTSIPWPTQQEAREARELAREGDAKPAKQSADAKAEKPDAASTPATNQPSPATSARKRKRRS